MQWQQVLVIRNSTVEGPLFQTILLNIFPIPKTGLYNLANTWKRQMTPLSREVTFSTNQWGCQRKRKIRTSKKEAQCITQHACTRKAAAVRRPELRYPFWYWWGNTGVYFHICQTKERDQFGCTVHFLASKRLTSEVKKYWLLNRHFSKEYIQMENR